MKDWKEVADQYCSQIDKIVSEMHEEDFFEKHPASEMMKMLEEMKEAKTQLSGIYTTQEVESDRLFKENGGGADNQEAFELDGLLAEIQYFCEIANDFIPELEARIQEKGEHLDNAEQYLDGLPDMVSQEDTVESESQTIEIGDVSKNYRNLAEETVESRDFAGKKPADVALEGEITKNELMYQIEKTINSEKKEEKNNNRDRENERQR